MAIELKVSENAHRGASRARDGGRYGSIGRVSRMPCKELPADFGRALDRRPVVLVTPHVRAQAIGCAAMGLLCGLCGLPRGQAIAPAPSWLGVPICHTGGTGWVSGFGAGFTMGLAMLLVSLAPLRWNGIFSIAGALTALLWLIGAGLLQLSILAGDQIAWAGMLVPTIPHLLILTLSMGAALIVPVRTAGRVRRTAFQDGAQCFLRCGPMMIAMMLTDTMSMPWITAGALLTQVDDAIGNRRLSRLLVWCIGLSAAAVIATTA